MKSLYLILIFAVSLVAQSRPKDAGLQQKYLQKLDEQNKFAAQCEKEMRERQLKEFGRVLPKIAGGCEWSNNGCPVNLVIPKFPDTARKWRISGTVKVEILLNENGRVIYAGVLQGSGFLRPAALAAAWQAQFRPLEVCGTPIMQRRIIAYNFRFR